MCALLGIVAAFLTLPGALANEPSDDFGVRFSAMRNAPSKADYTKLRLQWTDQGAFNPYIDSSDAYEEAYELFSSYLEAEDFPKAVQLCEQHYAEYWIQVRWNMRCEDAYIGLGKPEKATAFESVYTGLAHSIMDSGDGSSPESAFHVISIDEEYVVFAILDVSKGDQFLIGHDGSQYDKILVTRNDTEKTETLYFNVDLIFKWLNRTHDQRD
jgi:hypothetical protein